MRHSQTLVKHLRRLIREEIRNAPRVVRYSVTSKHPFTLEAFGSDLRLVDGQPDFDLAPGVRRRVQIGDTVLVAIDANGDHMALSETAGVAPSEEVGNREGDAGVEEAESGEKALSRGLGVLTYGAEAPTRPKNSFAHFLWIGNATPSSPPDFDLWIKPSTPSFSLRLGGEWVKIS